MARYVDLDKLSEELRGRKDKPFCDWVSTGILTVFDYIDGEDVAPVVHAHWETDKHAALDFCSSCGEAVERYVTAEQMDKSNYKGATYWNYCPHCGAKMDEVINDA